MYCEDDFLSPVRKMKNKMRYVENGGSFKCPKLPEITGDEESLFDKIKENWKKTDKKWIAGAAIGALALPALGFGALGPVGGGIAACKELLTYRGV